MYVRERPTKADYRLPPWFVGECPGCGCTEADIVRHPNPSSWLSSAGRARCVACRKTFRVIAENDDGRGYMRCLRAKKG
jgi:hypothetical protein